MRLRSLILAALLSVTGAAPCAAYSDRAGTDIVMDAPWRTVRDYIPVLFFFPQFEGSRRVERVRIVECVAGEPVGPPIVVDAATGPDTLNGATFIGPNGETRGGLTADEPVTTFWHYIVRVPHAALTHHGSPDVHDLRAEVEWTKSGLFGRKRMLNYRVLRVIVDPARFPRFDPADRYFDTHAHTIAEQTTSGWLDVNGAAKAFAGPLVMLLESAYALGLAETQPRADNWDAYADSLVVTDHNIFYSTKPYDTGTAPRFGPTADTDGRAGEAAWYRTHLGRLAGEEITLRRGSNQAGSVTPNIGHHLLAYDTRHFEGPWHGGLFLTSGLENPNTLEAVLAGMKAAGPGGFAYASHPNLTSFVWPPEYYAQAVGLPPYNTIAGPLVDSSGTEFLFKGAEVWNIKMDAVAHRSGKLAASSAFDHMNPFEGGPSAQRFERVPWDAELSQSLDTLFTLMGRGLRYSFREAPDDVFIRKLYLSAGSDAHGDFNYSDEVTATAVPYSGYLHRNAWARVRTCAFVHDRPAEARDAVAAFAEGNSVITDGPLLTFALDADGRHDPTAGAARWHDGESRCENADGRIGGFGAFDGGRTALVPLPGDAAWIRSAWKRSVTPGASDIAALRFDRVMESARDSFRVVAGAADAIADQRAPLALDRLCALVATARDTVADERCITNPVWAAPVAIEISARPDSGPRDSTRAQPAALLPPRSLQVVFRFPFSMSSTAPVRAAIRALDSRGVSTDPEWRLVPDPGWESEGAVSSSRLTLTNAEAIPSPPGAWDARSHAPAPGIASFVVYLERPADVHGNTLNDVGRAFAVSKASEPAMSELPPGVRAELLAWIQEHGSSPEEYVASQFDDHDVVFLGEYHRIRHDPELVQALIPVLYRHGVYDLGLEFLCARDQGDIDRLLAGKTYDAALANRLFWNQWPWWGYQEYVDILGAAWRFNHDLPAGARRFRIIGLNARMDWSRVWTQHDREDREIMKTVWPEGGADQVMAETIRREILDKREKALVYCGINHAYTRFRQPVFDEETGALLRVNAERAGNRIAAEIGKRTCTIFLHAPWPGSKGYSGSMAYPADGVIDALFRALPEGRRRVGFDLRGSPFGQLPATMSLWSRGNGEFRIESYCDGWIYQKPLSEYEGVRVVPGWFTEENRLDAIAQIANPDPRVKNRARTVRDLTEAMASDTRIRQRFAVFR